MKISIAMCTYNGEKYIEEQLISILDQSRSPDEIIICDDCSNDNTIKRIKECLVKTTISYKVVENKTNLGYIKNFEKCALMCTGDIVFFADQDDVWCNTKIEKMEKIFEQNPQCVLCYCDAIVTDEKMNKLYQSLNQQCGISKENFLVNAVNGKFPYGCTLALKRELLLECVPFQFGHDHYISMCAPILGQICCIQEPLIFYRRNDKAVTGYIRKNYIVRKFQRILIFINKVGDSNKEKWFTWPTAYIKSYGTYIEKFGEILKFRYLDVYKILETRVGFCKVLKQVIEAKKLDSIKILMNEYKNGKYTLLRGNRNTLLFDVIYLLLH